MDYFVKGQDGNQYGPVSLQELNEWIRENRLDRDTILQSAETGERTVARCLPGLNFERAGQRAKPPVLRRARDVYGGVEDVYRESRDDYSQGDDLDDLPRELIGRFNWGAALNGWIWGLNHRAYGTLLLLIFLPIQLTNRGPGSESLNLLLTGFELAMSVWFGFRGYEWAWKSGRFATVEECIDCQTTWAYWGVAVAVTIPCLFLSAGSMLVNSPR